MRLIFTDPHRPQDLFVIHDRTDSNDPLVHEGEQFTVKDPQGRQLLAAHHPRLQLIDEPKAARPREKQAQRAGEKRATKKT